MLYDQFLERFDKFNKIVKLIDTALHGRCEVRTLKGNDDDIMKVKFWYNPSSNEDDNCMLTLMLEENCIRCWYDHITDTNSERVKNFFLSRCVKLTDLWNSKHIEIDYDNFEEKIKEATNSINYLIDLWEEGNNIREKMQKQLDIALSKYIFELNKD